MGEVARITSLEERQRRTAQGTKILADIDMLRALRIDPGGVQWVPTGRTWEQELEGLTPAKRCQRWLELGFRFAVQKRDDGTGRAGWLMPEGGRDEMPEVAEKIPTGDVIDITSRLGWTPAHPALDNSV